jgi:hypothetical protein
MMKGAVGMQNGAYMHQHNPAALTVAVPRQMRLRNWKKFGGISATLMPQQNHVLMTLNRSSDVELI